MLSVGLIGVLVITWVLLLAAVRVLVGVFCVVVFLLSVFCCVFNSIVMLDASVRGLLLALLWLNCYCFLAEGCWWLGFYACLWLCLC